MTLRKENQQKEKINWEENKVEKNEKLVLGNWCKIEADNGWAGWVAGELVNEKIAETLVINKKSRSNQTFRQMRFQIKSRPPENKTQPQRVKGESQS